jgi:hypothetical protein
VARCNSGKTLNFLGTLFNLGRDREWAMAREGALVADLRKTAVFKH